MRKLVLERCFSTKNGSLLPNICPDNHTILAKQIKLLTSRSVFCFSPKFPRKYHEIRDKGIGKETKKRENEGTTDSSPVIFAKPGNTAVWKLMNERTKLPNTYKGKQTGRHILDQEINWDELIQGITVPDINRTEHNQENGCFGGHFDKIKTEVIKPEQEFEETVNTTKKGTVKKAITYK